jgi:hypothetical protein
MTENRSGSNYVLGMFLILLGILILLIQLNRIDWENFWPFILIAIGLLFILGFFLNRRNYGLLMPGSIFLIVGGLFLYMTQSSWREMEYLWPTFILAPGIGFLLMFLFGEAHNKLWVPGVILLAFSVAFYARAWDFLRYWPILLIVIGIYLIVRTVGPKTDSKEGDFTKQKP